MFPLDQLTIMLHSMSLLLGGSKPKRDLKLSKIKDVLVVSANLELELLNFYGN